MTIDVKWIVGVLVVLIIFLTVLGRYERSGKKKIGVVTATQTPKGFFETLEKKKHFGLIIAFGLFPMLVAIAMGWNPFGLWESSLRWAYLAIGLSGFVIGGLLRFQGDTARQLLMWMYVGLIVAASGRLLINLTKSNEEIERVLDRDWSISLPSATLRAVEDIDALDRNDVKTPKVWQDIGQPPNFGHRYKLQKGWNRTFVFKVAGEDEFYLLPTDADVVATFEGYAPVNRKPQSFTVLLERVRDKQGIWIPSEFNGRLYLYSAASDNEVWVYKLAGGFWMNPDRHFLSSRSSGRSDVMSEAEDRGWQMVLRNPDLTFELPKTRFEEGQELKLWSSGPVIWMNGSKETLLGATSDRSQHTLLLGKGGYLRLRAVGPHDVFLCIVPS